MIWKPFYSSIEGWTTIDHALQQHRQLLETGGRPCKLLIYNVEGNKVASVESPITITAWDTPIGTSPRKKIWSAGDDVDNYPDPQGVRVYVDGVELTQTYDSSTISLDTEFYIKVVEDELSETDSVSIVLNSDFVTAGKTITYYYTTQSRKIDQNNMQSEQNTENFRSLYGWTQYKNPVSKFRGENVPNTLTVSFPVTPPFDTNYAQFGRAEEWQSRAWTMGDVVLAEKNILYRMDDERYFELKNWEPNYIKYKGEWKLLTQSFEVTQLSPTDCIRDFVLE